MARPGHPLARSCARQTDGTATKWPDRATPSRAAARVKPTERRPSGPTGPPPRAQLRASNRNRRPSGPTGPPPRAQLRASNRTATKWPDRATPSRAAARVKPRRRPSGPTGPPPRAQLRASNRGDQVARPGPSRAAARVNRTATKWPDRASRAQLRATGKGPTGPPPRAQLRANRPATKWPDRATPSRAAARVKPTERRPSGPTGPPPRAQLRASNRPATKWPDRATLARSCARQPSGRAGRRKRRRPSGDPRLRSDPPAPTRDPSHRSESCWRRTFSREALQGTPSARSRRPGARMT